jgi:hypothetical protein
MHEFDPTPQRTHRARPASNTTSGAPMAGGAGEAGAARSTITAIERERTSLVRRLLTETRYRRFVAAAVLVPIVGLSAGVAPSSVASAAQSASSGHSAGTPGSGGRGSNARSGPAAGGSSGTVTSVTTSGFTMTTSADQMVTVDEASSTTYKKGSSAISRSAIKKGAPVLVLGTVSSTTIKATQVIVETTGGAGSAAATAATVIPFQKGAPTTAKHVGQIPATYTEGSGTIVSGTTATKATEAALAAYPGGVVDRVVKLSNGDYEVHNIGVNWPHHVFVNQEFRVIGAE